MKTEKSEPVYVHLDIKKIFLTPPNTRKEKIILVLAMVLVFMLYFGPLTFSAVHPVKAILISCIPNSGYLCPYNWGHSATSGTNPWGMSSLAVYEPLRNVPALFDEISHMGLILVQNNRGEIKPSEK